MTFKHSKDNERVERTNRAASEAGKRHKKRNIRRRKGIEDATAEESPQYEAGMFSIKKAQAPDKGPQYEAGMFSIKKAQAPDKESGKRESSNQESGNKESGEKESGNKIKSLMITDLSTWKYSKK